MLQGLRYSIIVEASETICDGTEGLCIVLKILSKPKPFLRFAVKPLSPAYEVKKCQNLATFHVYGITFARKFANESGF